MCFSCCDELREQGASAMLMERCYFNSAPIAVSFTKNVLFRRLNGVIRNEYELFWVYPKRADTAKIQGSNLARFSRNHDA